MAEYYVSSNEVKPVARCQRCGNYHEVRDSNPPGINYVKCPTDGSLFMVGLNGLVVIDADGYALEAKTELN